MKRAALLSLIGCLLLTSVRLAVCDDHAHDFGKWEKEISAYEQMDRTNPPPKQGVLFVGSSTIRLWKTLDQDFPGQRVINRGFGGCEIEDCTHFAGRIVLPYQPRLIFFRAGGNDLWDGKSLERVFADFKDFVVKVHAKLPETDVYFISWSPTIARWKQADKEKALNTMVAAYARQAAHVKYIETYGMVLGSDGKPRAKLFVDDQLHFNAEGYKLLVERVRPYLPKSTKF